MIKKITVLAVFVFSFNSFSQELVSLIPLDLKRDRDVFQVVNEATKETTLFLSDKKRVKAIRLSEKMQVLDSMSAERPDTNYSNMIGTCGDKSNPMLFWASSNDKEIFTQKFNITDHKVSEQKYDLTFKGEKVVQKFSFNGHFYILSIIKESNILKFYIFNEIGKTEKTIDLTGFKYLDSELKKTTLYGLLAQSFEGYESQYSLTCINLESPTSMLESSRRKKSYLIDKSLILTFDNNHINTHIIKIDLESFSASEKIYKKGYLEHGEFDSMITNSFMIENKLFQIIANQQEVDISLKDLDDNFMSEYDVIQDKTIDFKNSDIIQEDGSYSKRRILNTSNQFIRKISNLHPAVSCFKLNGNYLMTIGSVSEVQQDMSAAIVGGALFGIVGSVILQSISSSTMNSFNSYANRKVVYINCLLDSNGKHINEFVKPIAFDNIRKFLDGNQRINSQTIYKLDNTYYLGFFENGKKEYSIRKFVE